MKKLRFGEVLKAAEIISREKAEKLVLAFNNPTPA